MNWQVHYQALRTLGILVSTLVLGLYLPHWTHVAAVHSPFLALSVLIVAAVTLGRLWHGYHSDVSVTFFRLLMRTATETLRLKEKLLECWRDDALCAKLRARKLDRLAVFLLMAQYCLLPGQPLAWLHSLLAYKFLLDIATCIKREVEKRRQGLASSAANMGAHPAAHGPAAAHGGAAPPQLASSTGSPAAVLGSSGAGRQAGRMRVGQRPLRVLIAVAKGVLAAAVLLYQTFYVNVWYVLTTLTYFAVTRAYLSRPLTRLLETAQGGLDGLDGLEQYYVVGLLGVVEVLFAAFFMVWTLIQHQQFLMLVALYTNIYTGGRDVLHHAVSAVLAEWTLLAHFERATEAEIRRLDDVCAVCLSAMTRARKTPCGHFFHGHCLRRCLKEKVSCPICNFKFKLV